VCVYFCEVRGCCIAIQKQLYEWPLTSGEKSKTSAITITITITR